MREMIQRYDIVLYERKHKNPYEKRKIYLKLCNEKKEKRKAKITLSYLS
jgi:hypothetical protein